MVPFPVSTGEAPGLAPTRQQRRPLVGFSGKPLNRYCFTFFRYLGGFTPFSLMFRRFPLTFGTLRAAPRYSANNSYQNQLFSRSGVPTLLDFRHYRDRIQFFTYSPLYRADSLTFTPIFAL